jgi:hypothetical protein
MEEIKVRINEPTAFRVSLKNISISDKAASGSHSSLKDRDLADQHPITAITGLEEALRLSADEEKISEAVKAAFEAAKSELKAYVDEAILGGAW